jgi:hypothetical protein
MTAIAPNLGKLFIGCTKRPATTEDIALLQAGDWISERDCPWSWLFLNSCQDMAIGVWEGKEFFVPHHLLMICEVIEGQVVEKFSKKPDSKFKVGDRIIAYKGKPAASAVIHDARIENGRIQIIWDDVQDKMPRWFAVDTLRLEQELGKSTDSSFKKSTISFSVGDRFAVCPGVTNECEIIGLLGSKYLVCWSLKGDEQEVDAAFLAKLKSIPSPKPEKFFNNQESCSQPDTSFAAVAAIPKEVLKQDINPSGQSMPAPMPVASTENASQEFYSLSKTSVPLQMSLLPDSQYQMSAYSLRLAQIFPWLVSEMDLLEFADNCFLKDSDLFDSNAQPHLSLKTLTDSLAQTKQLPSRKSSKRLQIWGIAAPGNLGMVTGTSPKIGNGFSSWAITAEIITTQPKPGKKSLAEIIGQGNAIVYRAAGGDRIYHKECPTLRSLSNTGNHQSGSGAYKVREMRHGESSPWPLSREYQGETYLERPINATEAEQLMGWEVGSTAIGINKEGDEINISQTQRIKMLGNGIIPAEITDILTAIKPILERKLEGEVPKNRRFAYRQLRRIGISHQDAINAMQSGG